MFIRVASLTSSEETVIDSADLEDTVTKWFPPGADEDSNQRVRRSISEIQARLNRHEPVQDYAVSALMITIEPAIVTTYGFARMTDHVEHYYTDSGDQLHALKGQTGAVFDGEPVEHHTGTIAITWRETRRGGQDHDSFEDEVSFPASEDWEPEVYDKALQDGGWLRVSDWNNDKCTVRKLGRI